MTNVAARPLRLLAVAVALSLWVACLGLAPAGASPTADRQPRDRVPQRGGEVVDGEVIVKWAAGAQASARAGARGQHGIAHARSAPRTGVQLHRITTGRSPHDVARDLSRDPRVEYAEPNYLVHALADPPNDAAFGQLWGLRNTGQSILGQPGVAGIDVDALEAWDTTRGDEDVVVAVIDEGTDRDHPDLTENMWVNPTPDSDPAYPGDLHGWDFLNGDNTVFDPVDGDAHGTHVSGTIAAAAGNGIGVAGVAPDATIMPLKFLGPETGNTFDAALAIDYAAARGARIVNASWGGSGSHFMLPEAIENSGMAFIAAAGNEGADNDSTPSYPCNFDLSNVLCVAAIDNDGGLAEYSNYGATTVDVGAPGTGVLSTVPRLPEVTVALQIDAPAYDAMYWGFGLSDVVGDLDEHAAITDAALDHLGTAADDPILLVDDDESGRALASHPDVRPWYTAALDAGGFTDVDVRDVAPNADGPTAVEMAGHTVIWFTGDAYGDEPPGVTTLTAADQVELTAFLDAGGRLLLAGADAVYRIEDSAFVTDRLHADIIGETTGRAGLEGQPGTVYAGQTYALLSANSFIKNVLPASGAAVPALSFPGDPTYATAYSYFQGTSMATPHVSGVAALVAAARPDLSGVDIVNVLKDSVVPLPSLSGETTTGGMVNAPNALAVALGAPRAPTGVSAAAGDGQATVSWSAPANEGDSPITGYTVTAQPGGASVSVGDDAREATVTGLTNGQDYTFTVRASNAIGQGPASAPSTVVTPLADQTVPGAPTGVSAVAGDSQATVSWSAPADEGGSPITGYTVTAQPGGETAAVGGAAREATVTGLSNGLDYTFTVRASNAVGQGPASAASDPVIPLGVPGSPTAVSAVAGDGRATVSWTAPDSHGGAQITGYTVTAEPGGASVPVGGDAREATVTGLANGQEYTFTVRATNLVGDGPSSAPSAPVTPRAGDACPSGAVPNAGFSDVAASNVHATAIDCAAWYGLAQGTSASTFGPDVNVRRDQMASFIGRLIEETGIVIDVSGSSFTDVAGNVHAPRINALAAADIVQGVSPGTYAPGALVTRDQMASFLVRTYEFIAQETLAAPAHGFTDVAGNVHATAIAKAAGAEFARGLTETTYGPRQPVRRDQMASFLTRVLQRLVTEGLADTQG